MLLHCPGNVTVENKSAERERELCLKCVRKFVFRSLWFRSPISVLLKLKKNIKINDPSLSLSMCFQVEYLIIEANI